MLCWWRGGRRSAASVPHPPDRKLTSQTVSTTGWGAGRARQFLDIAGRVSHDTSREDPARWPEGANHVAPATAGAAMDQGQGRVWSVAEAKTPE
jgi:hypothetical protein